LTSDEENISLKFEVAPGRAGIVFLDNGASFTAGGDDRRVLLWHMDKAIHGQSMPVKLKGEHLSNIFCLAFDSTNKKVFSGGKRRQNPSDVFTGSSYNNSRLVTLVGDKADRYVKRL